MYLYGTDFMSTGDIRVYIGLQYPNIEINWINDSSCTLKFQTNEEAAEAYLKFSVRPATFVNESTTTSDCAEDEKTKLDERNFDCRIGWREALSY